ncbi:hypothetical protein [Cupriavidus respiraculi]|uniref:hypothetical protein n=1 Tax=Cupriavidus respiraculi TaxID=195930 RepID=UPI001F423C9E|nr:hypothetical protein [Cupriavidus respiraculi]
MEQQRSEPKGSLDFNDLEKIMTVTTTRLVLSAAIAGAALLSLNSVFAADARTHAGDNYGYVYRTVDAYTDGARKVDAFTDGARQADPFTDGARERDAFSEGARTAGQDFRE